MIFVLLILLLSGVISASLLHNSMIGNKIINNHIKETKTELTGRAGYIILNGLIKEGINVKQFLAFSYGEEYNILINKVEEESFEEKNEQEYEVIGSYKNSDKVLYYTHPLE